MKKPIAASVTSRACKCKSLERAADEPTSNVEFDPGLNEYNIRTRDGGTLRIYHCFFCGGAAPHSKRSSLFAVITNGERERLQELTTGFTTLADVIRRFGKPDDDMPTGLSSIMAARNGKPPTTKMYRVIRYRALSKTAEVEFVDYGPEHGVRATLQGKYLGKPKRRARRTKRAR